MVTPKKTAIITGSSRGVSAATLRRMDLMSSSNKLAGPGMLKSSVDNGSDFNWRAIFLFVVFTSVVLAFFLFSRNGSYGSVDGPSPIPPSERSLPTTVARPWSKVSNGGIQLGSLAFDREGHLLFLEIYGGSSNNTREKN